MTSHRAFARQLSLAALLLTGCGPLHGGSSSPSPSDVRREWRTVAAQAGQEVRGTRYGIADRILADFVSRYPGTGPASEALYARALYRLDPANPNASPREAVVLLDSALATPDSSLMRTEATALRRVALALEAKPTVVTVTTPAGGAAPKADDKGREEEVAHLKDELAKANAELERIKRRLAAPKP
jgi:hypothetical protein